MFAVLKVFVRLADQFDEGFVDERGRLQRVVGILSNHTIEGFLMEAVMITTTLNALSQARRLGNSVSTGVYDDGELEALLVESTNDAMCEVRNTQFLSPEILAQILAGGFRASNE